MTGAALHNRAAALADGLPPLLLRARRLAATVAAGAHGRRRPGSGDEFWQFRHSQPGDPLTAIDWRQSGKSDHLFIRDSEWTVAQTTQLWIDPSASMRWRSGPGLETKFERACLLAVALTVLLEQAGERIALLQSTGPAFAGRGDMPAFAGRGDMPAFAGRGEMPAFAGRAAPMRLAQALLSAPESRDWPLPGRRRGPLLVISDFLLPLDQLERQLGQWSAQGLSGTLLQILDPAEHSLAFSGRVRLKGVEDDGEVLLADAGALRQDYAAAVEPAGASTGMSATGRRGRL